MRISILLAASMTSLAMSACSRPGADALDAGATDAAPPDGGAGTVDAAVTMTAPATTASAPVASATPAPFLGTAPAPGGIFQGNFPHCLTGGLKTEQRGAHVTGHSGDSSNPKMSHDVLTFTCAIAGDVCAGTATTATHAPGGKITRVGEPRKMRFTRRPDGTFTFSEDGQPAPSSCGKPS